MTLITRRPFLSLHPTWIKYGEYGWLIVVILGAALEIYAAFINPHVPTFTGMVKNYTRPTWRAAGLGVLAYHFLIQPIFEALAAKGIKIF